MNIEGEKMVAAIKVKMVYGEKRYYPENEIARLFAKLTGNKTLTRDAVKTMLEIGVTIQVIQDEEHFH